MVSDDTGEAPGERIARARRRRGLSQAVLAGLAGRSESWLSQVERGKRAVDSHAVLTRMAVVLRVEVDELTGPDRGAAEDGQRVYEPAAEIERAMTGYDAVGASIGGPVPDGVSRPAHLRAMAKAAYAGYQATRYDDTGRVLPALICQTEQARRVAGGDSREACSVRALVYDTAAALLHRVGESGLAWAAADRALSAAEQSGRPELVALQAYRLSYVITTRRRPAEALELAMSASAGLERTMCDPGQDTLSVYGALHLAGANAASAGYDRAMTASLLVLAREIAARTGDGNRMGTAFGQVNVAMHSISASLQLGDAKAAIETGESLDPAALPAGLTGRRTQLSLDLARAYAMRKQDAAAVNLLLSAERLSPQLVRYDGRTREVITGLLRREHQPSTPELRPLAHRAGVI
jgi:transcriptional regulator with XRE-family HTH domain